MAVVMIGPSCHQHQKGETMKIALLSRVSTSKQDNENQLLQLREFAGKQGWEIVAEYVDTVTGSGKKARDKFDAMMLAMLRARRRFDVWFCSGGLIASAVKACARHCDTSRCWMTGVLAGAVSRNRSSIAAG